MQEYDIFAKFITTIGFPIFVAVWMMVKTSKDTQSMTTAIKDLKDAFLLFTANNK